MVFETLNDRGLDLSIADLLKNHLFSLAARRGELTQVTALWGNLVTTLENISLPRFLRHYWLSHHRVVTQRNLYGAIKTYLKDHNKSPRTFSSELITDAQFYSQLVFPQQGDSEALTLRDLHAMGIAQNLPFLMAAKGSLKAKEISEVIRLVETLTMRFQIVGNQNPNQLERKYSEWAIMIRKQKPLTVIIKDADMLLSQVPSFVDGFQELAELPAAQTRYILRKINEHKTSEEMELAWKGVDIEHILPQTPSDEWLNALNQSEDELAYLSKKLGNLTLLSKRLNRSASNKPFDEKLEKHYKKSAIAITKELREFTKWDGQSIDKRQKEFANIAKEIWRV